MPIVVLWHSDKVKRAVRGAVVLSLRQLAEHVLEESGRNVPHLTGTLERSGEASDDEAQGIAMVSYGSTGGRGAGAYAVKQHEDVTLRHPNGRTAKFLENAVKLVAPNMLAVIHGKVKKVFDG